MSRPRVKICGLTRLEDAELAVELGADAVGFVLWPRSPRAIGVDDAAAIAHALPPFVARVGVFVDASPAVVAAAARAIDLDVAQLHGSERVDAYFGAAPRVIKALSVSDQQDVARAASLPPQVTVLIDAQDSQKRGGTGRNADWVLAAEVARVRRIVLAGGLNAANVSRALNEVRPWAVDVSSGVEEAPGRKSATRLREFFDAIKS
jgi:phosphoribosylanthranilate isomerase